MIDNVVRLFPKQQELGIETVEEMMVRVGPMLVGANRAVLLLVNDVGGQWEVHLATANMSNAEANLAVDIVKDLIIGTVVGV